MADNPHGPFFRRAVPSDRAAFLNAIEAARATLPQARANGSDAALIMAAGTLGSLLFQEPGCEAEAATLLEEALALARKTGDRLTEIDGLLGLGTAIQYLGRREEAIARFEEGLRLVAATGIRAQEHFLLHHMGRCLVEMGRIAYARAAFEQALAIRKTLGHPRFIASTEGALADIAER